jgi:hypothetical protein
MIETTKKPTLSDLSLRDLASFVGVKPFVTNSYRSHTLSRLPPYSVIPTRLTRRCLDR